jgi:hypothetical protein
MPYDLPFTVKRMVRGGQWRKCVIQYDTFPSGHHLKSGRIVYMGLAAV